MNRLSFLPKPVQHFIHATAHFMVNLVGEFREKGCQKNAAALTYMTLFALVPMMTVTYSMFSVIPAFNGVADQLQGLIFESFLPETSSDIQAYLSDFSSQARSLTGFGVGMLVVTAYLMLTNIEKTFNNIWGVKEARRGLSSFLLYWAVLSIGPLLLGAGLVMSTYVLSVKMVVQEYDQLGLTSVLFSYVPIGMTSIAFTLLFAAVPNCRVPIRFAITGGVVTALCFELLKMGFAALVANSSFKLIYGAFAVVPLFLLWINFLWMIVLAGAVFVRTLAEHAYSYNNRRYSDMRAVLHCLAMFREKSQAGDIVNDRDCVAAGINLVHWQSLRSLLTKSKWIAVTESGGYVLSRDLQSVTLWDLVCLVRMPMDEPIPDINHIKADEQTREWISEYFSRGEEKQTFTNDKFNLPLEDLFACKWR